MTHLMYKYIKIISATNNVKLCLADIICSFFGKLFSCPDILNTARVTTKDDKRDT